VRALASTFVLLALVILILGISVSIKQRASSFWKRDDDDDDECHYEALIAAGANMSGHELREVMEHLQELSAAAEGISAKDLFDVVPMASGETGPLPEGCTKRVHLIRHGQGYHNVWGAEWFEAGKEGNAYADEGCPVDPELTSLGQDQARNLIPKMRSIFDEAKKRKKGIGEYPMVIVSPLRRATQTALIALDSLAEDAIIVATDRCREEMGLHRCDKRLAVSDLKAQFGTKVDYMMMQSHEQDTMWNADAREKKSDLVARALEFALWFENLPEEEVVVASHSSFLLTLVAVVFKQLTPKMSPQDAAKLWFSTGEMRTFAIKQQRRSETSY